MSPDHPALVILDKVIEGAPNKAVTFEVFRAMVGAFLTRIGDLETADRDVDKRLRALEGKAGAIGVEDVEHALDAEVGR